jgi:hypothetical protein
MISNFLSFLSHFKKIYKLKQLTKYYHQLFNMPISDSLETLLHQVNAQVRENSDLMVEFREV